MQSLKDITDEVGAADSFSPAKVSATGKTPDNESRMKRFFLAESYARSWTSIDFSLKVYLSTFVSSFSLFPSKSNEKIFTPLYPRAVAIYFPSIEMAVVNPPICSKFVIDLKLLPSRSKRVTWLWVTKTPYPVAPLYVRWGRMTIIPKAIFFSSVWYSFVSYIFLRSGDRDAILIIPSSRT